MYILALVLATGFALSGPMAGAGQLTSVDRVTLEGRVTVAGTAVLPVTTIHNSTDPGICEDSYAVDDFALEPGSRGLANVVLAVVGVPKDLRLPAVPGRLAIDNRGCRFVPHVAVLQVGSEIEARNRDSLLHTTHFYGPREANLALPFEGSTATILADKPGLFIVKCDVHGWMQAFVRVDDHGFHAVSGADGRFRIEALPPETAT